MKNRLEPASYVLNGASAEVITHRTKEAPLKKKKITL